MRRSSCSTFAGSIARRGVKPDHPLGPAVEVVVVEPRVEVGREVRVQHLALAPGAGRAHVEDLLLEPRREEERKDGAARVRAARPLCTADALDDAAKVEGLEPRLRPREVERRPVVLLRVADLQLVRVDMALAVPVEELEQERPAGALDLRDQDERLTDRHDVGESGADVRPGNRSGRRPPRRGLGRPWARRRRARPATRAAALRAPPASPRRLSAVHRAARPGTRR